jgi:hypothetical protein
MVGVTGLEPATSRPPAVRATNCATPRLTALVYLILILIYSIRLYLALGLVTSLFVVMPIIL